MAAKLTNLEFALYWHTERLFGVTLVDNDVGVLTPHATAIFFTHQARSKIGKTPVIEAVMTGMQAQATQALLMSEFDIEYADAAIDLIMAGVVVWASLYYPDATHLGTVTSNEWIIDVPAP